MLVFCNGMPRSASTWSFAVVIELLRRCLPDEEVHSAYDEDVAHFLQTAPASAKHAVLKSHALDDTGRSLARCQAAKVVYTHRDLADAVVSSMSMFGYGFEHSLSLLRESLDLFRFHRHTGNAVIVSYRQITHDPLAATEMIAGYLGVDIDRALVQGIAEELSLDSMTQKSESKKKEGTQSAAPDQVVLQQQQYDPQSLLLHHIRNGGTGYGKEQLTAEQLKKIKLLRQQHGLMES